MPTTLGLLGRGRLGQAIRAAAVTVDDLEVAWAVGREAREEPAAPGGPRQQGAPGGPPHQAAPGGPPQPAPWGLPRVDVAIDVSHAAAVPWHLAWATRTGTPLVIGTTGWDPGLLPAAPEVPVLVAPNFSLGAALVRRLAAVIGGYAAQAPAPVDLAVTETHHRHKVDSPSGTALAMREALARGAGRPLDAVQTTSLRLGQVVGEHEVVAASALETITLRHTAHSRDLFAAGALAAARWLSSRTEPGRYTLDDLAADQLPQLLGASTPHLPHDHACTTRTRSEGLR